MYVYRRLTPLLKRLVRAISRPRLHWSERPRKKAINSAINSTVIALEKSKRNGFIATQTILNIGLFFLIAERDIQAVKIDALTHPDVWQRNLAARVILLTVHELDMDKVAGAKLRQALNEGKVPVELRDSVTEAMRTIRKAQQNAQKKFAYLRNSTIAHRDPDAIRQYNDINSIDSLEVIRIAADFYDGTKMFMNVLPNLLMYLGTWQGLMSQLDSIAAGGESKN